MSIRCPKCGVDHYTRSAANFDYCVTSATEQEIVSCSKCRPQIVCNKCGVSVDKGKACELFDYRKSSPTGFQYACKKCRRSQNAKYKDRLSEEQKSVLRERSRDRKRKKNEAAAVKKRDHDKKIKSYAEHINNNEAVGATARTFHFGLKLILERQLDLYYNSIKTITGRQKKRRVIEDALFEIQDLLTRVSDRMKKISEAETETPFEDPLNGVKERRIKALLVLGLPGTATDEDIKRRYKNLARVAHPDHGGNAEKMAELNAAMATLEGSR